MTKRKPPEQQEGGCSQSPNENNRVKRHKHIRDKIRASVILDRLEKNALGELEPPMTQQQIKSAEVVLKKVIPDLSSVTVNGDEDSPLTVINRIELVAPRVNAKD